MIRNEKKRTTLFPDIDSYMIKLLFYLVSSRRWIDYSLIDMVTSFKHESVQITTCLFFKNYKRINVY